MKLSKMLILMIAMLLVGCSSEETEVITVCENQAEFNIYTTDTKTLTSLNGTVTSLSRASVLEVASLEARNELTAILDSAYKSINALEGVYVSYEIIDDTTILDKGEFDLTVVSIEQLMDLGILDLSESTDSLNGLIQQLEMAGYACEKEV